MNRKDSSYKLTIDQLRAKIAEDAKEFDTSWEDIEIESRKMFIKTISASTINTLLNIKELLENMSTDEIIEYGNLLSEEKSYEKEEIIELCANIARLKYYMV